MARGAGDRLGRSREPVGRLGSQRRGVVTVQVLQELTVDAVRESA